MHNNVKAFINKPIKQQKRDYAIIKNLKIDSNIGNKQTNKSNKIVISNRHEYVRKMEDCTGNVKCKDH